MHTYCLSPLDMKKYAKNSELELCLAGSLEPICIAYHQVIETEGYIQELLGKTKKPETLIQLVQAIELLKLNFGSIDVRFGAVLVELYCIALRQSLTT